MNKEFFKFVDDVYVLKALSRYNNKFKIINESVAEHCYFVILIVLKLNDYYKFNLEKALSIAAIHDLPEIYVSDVTHDVKKNFPNIKKALSEAEQEIMKNKFGKNFYDLYNEYEIKHNSIESKIVELADIISCMQYSNAEITLGNKGYMLDVYKNSKKRLNVLLKNIKENKR